MSLLCFHVLSAESSDASYKGQNLNWYFLISDTAHCAAGGEAAGETH